MDHCKDDARWPGAILTALLVMAVLAFAPTRAFALLPQTHVATVVSDHGINGAITIPAHDPAGGPLQSVTVQISCDIVRHYGVTNLGPLPAFIVFNATNPITGQSANQLVYVLSPQGQRIGCSAQFNIPPAQITCPGFTTLPPFAHSFLGLNSPPDTTMRVLDQFDGPPGSSITLPVKFLSNSTTTNTGKCLLDQYSVVTATITVTYN